MYIAMVVRKSLQIKVRSSAVIKTSLRETSPVAGYKTKTKEEVYDLPMEGAADGCIGCLLVFANREDAEKEVGDKGQVIEASTQ